VTVVAIVGPTAVGKSALSLALAERVGGEVINADSMQLYRGMNIGTAKLTPEQRDGVEHHLLDVWAVTDSASVAEYQRLARTAIDDILARGRVPLLVGGSGLYVRAALERFDFPGTDPDLRARLEAELATYGSGAMHARLAALDADAAAKILPSNGRRIVRALEVVELTGAPFAAALPDPTPVYPSVQIGIDLDAATLDIRIAARVHHMFDAGVVNEVRALLPEGLAEGRTASRALGYQQVLAYLDGRCDLGQATADTIQATRRFVRRQRTWFHRDPRISWLDAAAPDLVDRALALIEQGSQAAMGGS
jgi:tRNA dimethylallyltransferase